MSRLPTTTRRRRATDPGPRATIGRTVPVLLLVLVQVAAVVALPARPASTPPEGAAPGAFQEVDRPPTGPTGPPAAREAESPVDWDAVGRRAVELLREYLAIDTSNPPGNELEAARFFARNLERAGIPHEVFESEPGRGNVVARLDGDGSGGGGIVLLNHLDVVPADPAHWSVDPFGGEVRDGIVYGRGAVDMKAYGVVQMLTLVALHRAGVALDRDVVFLGTAGEETGGLVGAGYVVSQRPDLLEGLEFVLTEGGGGMVVDGRQVHRIETTQKTPLWLRLEVRGTAGHGSMPVADSAVDRLIRALERIRTFRGELQIVEPVRAALQAEAALFPGSELARLLEATEDRGSAAEILELIPPELAPLLRNTISITVLEGSGQTNVVPAAAYAELDCRLLPGQDPELFVATLRDVIDDPGIAIRELLNFPPSASPRDTPLWEAIEAALRDRDPEAAVVPAVLPGFTDSHYFREIGMVAYGWAPFVFDGYAGAPHGTDEAIAVDEVKRAPRLLFDVVTNLAARGGPSVSIER